MLFRIPLVTGLIFAAIYPLCFWISYRDPLRQNFHKFHVGLANFVGGVTVIVLLFTSIPLPVKILALVWKAALLSVSCFYWKKESPNAWAMTFPCVLGLLTFARVQQQVIFSGPASVVIGILAGFVLCSAIFSMNLGHWYLNVHGLPIAHLMRSVYVFGFFLGLRAIVDVYLLFKLKVFSGGEWIPAWTFMAHMDGFFLWIAIFFGTLFPLAVLYFVRGTLLVKSTQSATGILYVILSAVLIGDITYKYYLVHYGLAL